MSQLNGDHSHDARAGDDRHIHPVEDHSARSHPEFVVLEIGEDLGALILHTDPAMHGIEVEISPSGEDVRRSHKQVLERRINGHAAFTAVFDGLAAGIYTLWVNGRERARGVLVEAGAITELDWRTCGRNDEPGGAAA